LSTYFGHYLVRPEPLAAGVPQVVNAEPGADPGSGATWRTDCWQELDPVLAGAGLLAGNA
jgi:hypothetical protein